MDRKCDSIAAYPPVSYLSYTLSIDLDVSSIGNPIKERKTNILNGAFRGLSEIHLVISAYVIRLIDMHVLSNVTSSFFLYLKI